MFLSCPAVCLFVCCCMLIFGNYLVLVFIDILRGLGEKILTGFLLQQQHSYCSSSHWYSVTGI